MERSSLILGVLLWEAARYLKRFGIVDSNINLDLFDMLYPEDPLLKKLSAAIMDGRTNSLSEMIEEAFSLAAGGTIDEYFLVKSKKTEGESIPALSSILSKVRYSNVEHNHYVYHDISDLSSGISFNNEKFVNNQKIVKHLQKFYEELLFLKNVNSHRKPTTILMLLEKYFSCLPILGTSVNNDVSVSAISKAAAAISNCWQQQLSGSEEIPSREHVLYTAIFLWPKITVGIDFA